MPIRARLALAFAAITLALAAAGGVLFLRSFRHGLESSLDGTLRTQAASLVRELRSDGEALDLRGTTSGLPTNDAVAQVIDADGGVVTATREAGPAPVVSPARLAAGSARDRDLVVARVHVGSEHEPFRALVRPARTRGLRVMVASSLEATDAAVTRARQAVLLGGGIAVALATLGAWLVAGAALRPVERMRSQAAELSGDDPAGRLAEPNTHDEISALAATINDLLERVEHANTRQREFVADASHELRTPLAVLSTELELAQRPARTRDQLVDSIRHANTEVQRMRHLADELLFLARHDDDPTRPADDAIALVEVVEEAVSRQRHDLASREIALTTRVADTYLGGIVVDRTSFRRAVENLVDNAVRFAPDGGSIEVVVVHVGDDVVVSVLDEGPGFPPDFVDHAFERFRRTDDARARVDGGAGLGLAIVQAVAHRHHGVATAENRPGGGAAVHVRIPVDARM